MRITAAHPTPTCVSRGHFRRSDSYFMPNPQRRLTSLGVVLAIIALLSALWAGLLRLGWPWPAWTLNLPAWHGPLMVSGFLGTLIGLERAVALRRTWSYVAPCLTGLGGLILLSGGPARPGILCLTAGSLAFVGVSFLIWRREPATHTATLLVGACLWALANGLWLAGQPISRLSAWWAAFLLLIIAGERLELSRVLRLPRRVVYGFAALVGLIIGGLLVNLAAPAIGLRLTSLGIVGLGVWFGRYDLARRTIRRRDLTRYIAFNLLVGYGWLVVSGALGLYGGFMQAGPLYDAWLHSLFIGFVFSMIFAHALLILPALTGLTLVYHPRLYAPSLLLHGALLLRVVGDLLAWPLARRWGGLGNVIAILLFAALVVTDARRQRRAASTRTT